jgi:Flp pilus assembly protein TadG
MKKVLFVILALCFAGTLAFAQEADMSTAAKEVATTPAVSSTEVATSETTTTNTEAVLATDEAKDEAAATKDAAEPEETKEQEKTL